MLTVFLLLDVIVWITWLLWRERQARRADADWREARIAERRAVVVRHPDSPTAHEALGDVLRAADRPDEAVASYEAALAGYAAAQERARDANLDALLGGTAAAAGPATSGFGLESKLRLARHDAEHPDGSGETAQTRQQVCRRCGFLSEPGEPACVTCGEAFPADGFWDTLRLPGLRGDLATAVAQFLVVAVAIGIASGLSPEIKGVVILATAIVLAFRFLRGLNGDRDIDV